MRWSLIFSRAGCRSSLVRVFDPTRFLNILNIPPPDFLQQTVQICHKYIFNTLITSSISSLADCYFHTKALTPRNCCYWLKLIPPRILPPLLPPQIPAVCPSVLPTFYQHKPS